MSALTNPPKAKLRDNPEIAQLFRNAESRHLNRCGVPAISGFIA